MTGVIVAGGRSRRFGTDKAAHIWRGRPLLDHVRDAVAAVCTEVIVVGGPYADVADDEPGAGPLAALATAFAHLPQTEAHLFLTACDLPLLTPDVIRLVTGDQAAGAVVARTPDGRAQPLVARYPRTCLAALHHPGDSSLFGLLERIPVTYVDPPGPPDWALNANRPSDLAS